MKSSRCGRCFELDFTRFPAVVFESDDWGACEHAPTIQASRRYLELTGRSSTSYGCRLEGVDDLQMLFTLLRRHCGADGRPAVFTAYTSMGNPDFDSIRANNFTEYVDVGFDIGVPSAWNSTGVINCMRNGMGEGIWEPEYHSLLHHISPRLWLQLLNADSADGRLARELFDLQVYNQNRHIPEYEGYTLAEQNVSIQTGFSRFARAFGRLPRAAVTSDAYPETEMLWCVNGIRTVCLKNSRINSGEVVVYSTKPWNNQDVYAQLGDYNPMLDAVYLTRNAFFEVNRQKHDRGGNSAEEIMQIFRRNQAVFNEPTIISTHRANYCSYSKELNTLRFRELDLLLEQLSEADVFFLTSAELADLYRQGWSRRGRMLRKWVDDIEIPELKGRIFTLPERKEIGGQQLTVGNFLVEE